MAIGTDAAIEFFGTTDDLDSTSASVADNAFSVVGDLAAWTNSDDTPSASITGAFDFAVAPDVGSVINLYAALQAIDGATNQDVPTSDFGHTYMGSFPVKNVATLQTMAIDIHLPNTKTSQVYHFYIENKGGQSIDAGWSLLITPKTIGPQA